MPAVPSTELVSHLWKAAEMLRGTVDASSYKNCIVGLLMLKRLSDRFEEETDELIENGGETEVTWGDPDEHEFMVPEGARWSAIQAHATNLGEVLNRACTALADRNPRLGGWIDRIDFNDRQLLADDVRDRVLHSLVRHFSLLSLRNSDLGDSSGLGLVCQTLVARFAEDASKRGGEFHTPEGIVELLVQLVAPQPGMRICDPACGAGGVLVRCAAHVAQRSGRRLGVDPIDVTLHGQERTPDTAALCRMNMVLSGLSDARIELGDTIRQPRLVTHGQLMVYDRVITNPPFSLEDWGWESTSEDPFDRFRYGLPPRRIGDYAFVQHVLATLKPTGLAGIVVSLGVLFRGGPERVIRARLVDDDVIEAIIALPANLLHGTAIPVAILVLNRNKREPRKDAILFVDGSTGFETHGKRNELRLVDIERIVTAVRTYRNEDHFCRIAALSEIAANDYSLSVARYVDTFSHEAPIDIDGVLVALRELEATRDAAAAQMDELLRALGHGA